MATTPPFFKQALSHPNRSLANLYAQIEQQKKLLLTIRKALPSMLATYARHCVINQNKLVIYTDSAAWASQLRFYSRAILKAIEPTTRHRIELLQVRISEPIDSQPKSRKRAARIPSADKIAMISSTGFDDSDDPLNQALFKLRATLERLSGQAPDSPT